MKARARHLARMRGKRGIKVRYIKLVGYRFSDIPASGIEPKDGITVLLHLYVKQ